MTPEREAEIARLRRVYRETLAIEAEAMDAMREGVISGTASGDYLLNAWAWSVLRTNTAEDAWLAAKRAK